MHNHQVLATGYDDSGDGKPTLYVYDSNFPGQEIALRMDFTGSQLVVHHSGYGSSGTPTQQGAIRGVYCESYTAKTPPAGVVVESGLLVSPSGNVPAGGSVRLRYSARNTGFGPSPALKLYGVGRVVANGRNVDAGADRPAAEPLPEGGSRPYDKTVALTGDLGLRRLSVGVSVEHNGSHAWRTIPALTPPATSAFDIVVTARPGPWATLGGQLVSPPTAGRNADGRVTVAGVGLDNRLSRMEQTPPRTGWGGWVIAAANCPPLTGRTAIGRNSDGRVEAFARGADGAIWHAWQNRATTADWAAWSSLGDTFATDPAVVANQDGRLEVFAVSRDGILCHKWQFPFGWNGWADLGGPAVGRPGAVRHPDGRLEVFVRRSDGGVFHTWQRSPGGDWDRAEFGGQVTSDIAVANNVDGRVEVFARGTDGAVWHRWIAGGGWSDWASLGGEVPAGATPSVVLNSSGGLEVFIRGTDQAVWHNWHVPNPPYWSGWHSLGGGPVASDPCAVRNADGRIELLALGTDRTLVHRWQTGSGWNS
jgi:acylphosphatase